MSNDKFSFPQQPFCFGKVLQNQDKDHPNQVKVQLAVLYEEKFNETWAHIVSPFFGDKYGFCFVPEVGEQVLVMFVHDELPVVMGSVYGLKALPPECNDNKDNLIKVIKTKGNNLIKITDKKEECEIEIKTSGGAFISISDKDNKTTISDKDSKNSFVIDGKNGNITLSADKKLVLNVGGTAVLEADKKSVKLKSGKVTIQADQSLEEKAGQLKISGQTADINATGQLKISSNAITQLKGSILQLN